MSLKLITPPATEPVDLATVKNHLRVDSADDDALITALITAAREYCEDFQNRSYITQSWEMWLDSWPDKDYITIPLPPLQSVSSIKYYSTDDTEYTFDVANYFVDTKSELGRVALAYGKSWSTETLRLRNAVVVEFTSGYGNTADTVPQTVKQAILLLVAWWYEQRETVVVGSVVNQAPFAVNALLWLDRVLQF